MVSPIFEVKKTENSSSDLKHMAKCVVMSCNLLLAKDSTIKKFKVEVNDKGDSVQYQIVSINEN